MSRTALMLFKYIDILQRKPDQERRKIGFIISVAMTGLIFVVWLVTADFEGFGLATTTPAVPEERQGPSPIESFKELFSDFGESIEQNAGSNPPPETSIPAETYDEDPAVPMPPEGAVEGGL